MYGNLRIKKSIKRIKMGSKTSKASISPPKRIVFEPELSETQKIMEIKPKRELKLRRKGTILRATYHLL